MPDLRGIEEDVRFNWSAAQSLAASFRAAATIYENQISSRDGFATDALKEWRGNYAEQFRGRMRICAADARKLVASMRLAANQLDELGRLAHEEQNRREKARAWKKHQDNQGFFEDVKEFFGGDDDVPPPPDPVQPPVYTSTAQVSGSR